MNTHKEKPLPTFGGWLDAISIGLVFLSVYLPFLAKCCVLFVAHRIILQNAKIRQGYCVTIMEQRQKQAHLIMSEHKRT